ncbi:MAG: efflux RND transporter permease subunit [Lachnospiraceae bacterium]|nr:efflux RND transporter permease subunit [Lachnospiraceae bacterium]
MSKFSVKKPFTVLVMVIIMLMLGIVSILRMQLDLLPEVSLPYVLVITTYPGASPERVESVISEPMESSLGTITGVENVFSYSYENYSMVQLEFDDSINLDSVMVKIYTAIDTVKANFPEECGTPQILELGTDMLATMYLAAGYEGMEMEELSDFVEDTLAPRIERQEGVASVSTSGMIEKVIEIELNASKVDALNDRILAKANDAFAEAEEQLEDAKKKLEESEQTIVDSRKELQDGQKEINDSRIELAEGQQELDQARGDLEEGKQQLQESKEQTLEQLAQASQALDQLSAYQSQLLSQQAQQAVFQEAIEKITAALTEASEALNNVNALVRSLNTLIYTLQLGTTEELTEEEKSAISQLADTLIAAGYDASDLKEITNREEAIAALNVYLTTFTETQQSLQETVAGLSWTAASYQTEADALVLEIQVTQGIIAEYEKQLSALGVDYTDIEKAKLEAAIGFGNAEAQMAAGEAQLTSAQSQLDAAKTQLDSAQKQIDTGWDQLKDGQKQIEEGWDTYYDSLTQYEIQKLEALRNANADQLLSLSTLSGILYAQNFSMPAGYIDDAQDNSLMLKIGENYSSPEDIENLLLADIDDIGPVYLKDVADLTVLDNSNDSYAKLNGNRAVILSVFKGSTAGTNEVGKRVQTAIAQLEEEHPGLSVAVMMNQGDYIDLILGNVVQNMIIGASLAIIILAIFLRDVLPTIVVAISIPLSVLTSLICMYFTGVSLNMMSLSGMALGIGMLVDNSIVVIENIYRLRSKGVSAPRAAVQGTRQVAGAVVASTLTTVCVFFPMVYTTGLVRQLMLPMALTIIYCLMSSLLIAMTVVPASGSTLLRRTKPKEHRFFDRVQDAYAKVLNLFLRVKVVPLLLAIGLLAFSIWQVVRMGIVLIPEMVSAQMEGSLRFDEETDRETAFEVTDEVIRRIGEVDGIASVGAMAGGSERLLVGGSSSTDFTSYSLMILTEDPNAGAAEVKRMISDIEAAVSDLDVHLSISSGMDQMSAILGSGLSVPIYGDDLDTLLEISEDIMEIVDSVEGYTNISNGQEEADKTLHLVIDRNKAMKLGLTTAQIYQTLATEMTTSADALTLTLDGIEMTVRVVDETEPLTRENLLNYTFPVKTTDEDGNEVTEDHKLMEFAKLVLEDGVVNISRENQSRYITVSASVEEGYNTTLLTRQLEPLLQSYELPKGYSIDLTGEYETVNQMVSQMALVMLLGLAFVYLVMVAQFQSLLSPFIVLFTIPLAFTGGLLALWMTGEPLSIIALMGFLVLLGTVVNNGIVFVDYTNQLRIGGMERHGALIATGKTRMRPILMTALTTILAEASLIFGDDMGSQMGRGMALVIAGGLAYATLMTLFIIPVMYDILFKKPPLQVDVGSENLDDVPDDAAEFIAQIRAKEEEHAEGADGEPVPAADSGSVLAADSGSVLAADSGPVPDAEETPAEEREEP